MVTTHTPLIKDTQSKANLALGLKLSMRQRKRSGFWEWNIPLIHRKKTFRIPRKEHSGFHFLNTLTHRHVSRAPRGWTSIRGDSGSIYYFLTPKIPSFEMSRTIELWTQVTETSLFDQLHKTLMGFMLAHPLRLLDHWWSTLKIIKPAFLQSLIFSSNYPPFSPFTHSAMRDESRLDFGINRSDLFFKYMAWV